jgi:dethiobiotin synthetase
LISDDAVMIAAHSPVQMPMADINPYCFEPPVSPDVAAALAGTSIEFAVIEAAYRRLVARAEIVIVEGTGGWLTPIGPVETMADIPVRFGTPVLLVVGLTLGCINHALLTAEAIRSRGCRLAGWIGNRIDPDYLLPENNLATLGHWLGAPALAVLSHDELQASTQELGPVCARLF